MIYPKNMKDETLLKKYRKRQAEGYDIPDPHFDQ